MAEQVELQAAVHRLAQERSLVRDQRSVKGNADLDYVDPQIPKPWRFEQTVMPSGGTWWVAFNEHGHPVAYFVHEMPGREFVEHHNGHYGAVCTCTGDCH